jgi:putative hydrolase of the HAD superfamily
MSRGKRFDAVSFDVGGTLLEVWPSVGAVYAETAAEAGFAVSAPGVLQERFGAAWRGAQPFDHGEAGWRSLVGAVFAPDLAPGAIDRLFPVLYRRFAGPGPFRVFPEVPAVLTRLRRAGFRLLVVSNWDRRLHPLLRSLGLREAFELVLASAEEGVHKPDARLFERAAGRLGIGGSRIVHVGDGVHEDADGARGAGWGSWLLSRDGAHAGGDGVVSDLHAFADALLTEGSIGWRGVGLPAGIAANRLTVP